MVDKPSHLELHEDGVELTRAVRKRIDRKVSAWMKGHTDITGVSVAVRPLDSGRTHHAFQARVVLYHCPKNIAAVAKGEQPQLAIQTAMEAAERQLRAKRDTLRERWKRSAPTETAEVVDANDVDAE